MFNWFRRLGRPGKKTQEKDTKKSNLDALEEIIPAGSLAGDSLRAINSVEKSLSDIKPGQHGISQERIIALIDELYKIPSDQRTKIRFHIFRMRIVLENEGVDLKTWDGWQYSDEKRKRAFEKADLLIEQALIASGRIEADNIPKETIQ